MFEIMNQLALVIITERTNKLKPVGGTRVFLQIMNSPDKTLVAVFLFCAIAKVFFMMNLQATFSLL